MVKTNTMKKGFWKKFFLGLIVCLTAITSITALYKVTNKETEKTLSRFDYAIASVSTTTGKQVESNRNIVTKDFLAVEDMDIDLDDDATITYKVVFYGENKTMLSSNGITASQSDDFDIDDVPSTAKYFKVVITPATVDGEPVELNTFNVGGYLKQISISCHK